VSTLLNAAGLPEPSPEIQRRLRAVHPGLFLRFISHLPQAWAICMQWGEGDVRYAQVQAQTVAPDRTHDIIGYLPMDCSVDNAPGLLEHSLRTFPSDAANRAADFVAQAFPAEQQDVLEQSVEDITRELTKSRRKKR
jgi:hypothetical protein